MKHPLLEKELSERRFQRHFQRLGLPMLFMLAPPAVFAGITYYEVGYVSPLAVACTLATYALVSGFGAWSLRRGLEELLQGKTPGDSVPEPGPPGC